MATVVSNVQKILRHHIPLIRFKYGANQSVGNNSGKESKTVKIENVPSQSDAAQKSAALEFSQLPNKYRRRQLTQAEIDLVAIGGAI